MSQLLEAALGYARRNLPVFPCKPLDKRPLTSHGFKDATTDEGIIKAWWLKEPNANIGLPTGRASGLVVIDGDGKEGEQTLLGADLPATPTVRTGGGGLHLYFKVPALMNLGNGVRKLPGVDTRADGGYVLAPPSIHPNSTPYRWEVSLEDVPAPEIPAEFLSLLVARPEPQAEAPNLADGQAALRSIPEGDRNERLIKLAGAMRRQGATEEEIAAALLKVNEVRCKPPLSVAEVQKIAASSMRYKAAPITRPRTDAGNAEVLGDLFGDKVRFDHKQKRWLVWKDYWWTPESDGEVSRFAVEVARHLYRQAGLLPPEDRNKEAAARWAVRSESAAGVGNTLQLVQITKPMADSGENWDQDPWLLGVENGVVDLKTGKLIDGQAGQRITMHAATIYDPAASCPLFESFIKLIFDNDTDMIAFIQRAIGASLPGDTGLQVYFICYGTGGNGKSTLLNTFGKMLADYGRVVSKRLLLRSKDQPHEEALADLYKRRFVYAVEANEGATLDAALLKALTGGDTQTGRLLYKERFEFTPDMKVWLGFNHKPTIKDATESTWRRLKLIPFNVNIAEKLGAAQEGFCDLLRPEWPGILRWAVDGCLAWQREGLKIPEAVTEATAEYRLAEDVVGRFVRECCVLKKSVMVSRKQLRRAFTDWQSGNDERVVSAKDYNEAIRAFGVGERPLRGTRYWMGIGLLESPEEGGS